MSKIVYDEEYFIEKLPKLCQCCYQEGENLKNIFQNYKQYNENEIYSDMLKECFFIDIKTPLRYSPSLIMICVKCIENLRNSLSFRRRVESTQEKIKEIMKDLIIEDKIMTEKNLLESSSINSDDWMTTNQGDDTANIHFQDITDNVSLDAGNSYDDEFVEDTEHLSDKIFQRAIERTKRNLQLLQKSSLSIDDLKSSFYSDKIHYGDSGDDSGKDSKAERRRKTRKKWVKIRQPYNLEPDATDCNMCPKKFKRHSLLVSHMAEHFPNFVCAECGKVCATQLQMKGHQRTMHNNVQMSCPICERIVKKENLKRHIALHNSEYKPHKCKYCSERFRDHNYRELHMKDVHGATVANHVCSYCNKDCKTSGLLNKHVIRVHSDKKHLCPECYKLFATRTDLKNHMAKHTDERNHKCSYCSKAYKTRKGLGTHIHKHH